jgi:hypothetical protein
MSTPTTKEHHMSDMTLSGAPTGVDIAGNPLLRAAL